MKKGCLDRHPFLLGKLGSTFSMTRKQIYKIILTDYCYIYFLCKLLYNKPVPKNPEVMASWDLNSL
jgi:hypothetical protein